MAESLKSDKMFVHGTQNSPTLSTKVYIKSWGSNLIILTSFPNFNRFLIAIRLLPVSLWRKELVLESAKLVRKNAWFSSHNVLTKGLIEHEKLLSCSFNFSLGLLERELLAKNRTVRQIAFKVCWYKQFSSYQLLQTNNNGLHQMFLKKYGSVENEKFFRRNWLWTLQLWVPFCLCT